MNDGEVLLMTFVFLIVPAIKSRDHASSGPIV
jgi:hypothetical protein